MYEMKNAPDCINRRSDFAEEKIREFEDMVMEAIVNETGKKKEKKEQSIPDLWETSASLT